MQVKTIIVDDEKLARDELEYLLSLDQRFKVIAQAASGSEAVSLIKDKQPDLILLDIKMPDLSGIEVVAEINNLEKKPVIVFTTAYDQYAVKAFQLAAVDYLLKPISEERFTQTLERVCQHLLKQDDYQSDLQEKIDKVLMIYQKQEKNSGKIPVEINGHCKLLDQNEIYYFATRDKKVYAHCFRHSYLTNYNLTDLEDILTDKFFRVHRSYIVNLCQVKEVIPWFKGNYYVITGNNLGNRIPVSRKKVQQLNDLLNIK